MPEISADRSMDRMATYAVSWQEGEGQLRSGRLRLEDDRLELEGRGDLSRLAVPLAEIASVRIGRIPFDRLRGLPVLVVERFDGSPVRIATVIGVGALHEISERVARATWGSKKRSADPLSVLVAGGGVAALEATLALRALAVERVSITILSPKRSFEYRPFAVLEPFRFGPPYRLELAELARDCAAQVRIDSLVEVDPEHKAVDTGGGERLSYDALLVAVGASATAGVAGAICFWDGPEAAAYADTLRELEAGHVRHLVFAVPSGMTWPLPLYELALLTAARLAERGVVDTRLTLVTSESAPLGVFGSEASTTVAELLERHAIGLRTDSHAHRFERGSLVLSGGARLRADRVVSLPRLEGPRLAGLPQDANGFVPVDAHGRVNGQDRVFAAGDAASFPVKQGGLAAQQADAAAETIAALAGAPVRPRAFRPVLQGRLTTEEAPLFLRAELAGGHGETSEASAEALWWPPGKIAARYLAPYLAERAAASTAS